MSGPRERELKLDLTPAELAALERRALVVLGAISEGKRRLESTYYDTPDDALRRAGMTLRLRYGDGGRQQTVKTSDGAGLFDRGEWTTVVAGEGPDLDALEDTPLATLLKGRDAATLLPRFRTVIDRGVWRYETGVSAIEIALDRGEVVPVGTGDGSVGEGRAFAEVELELKRGDPLALIELARALRPAKPPRIGVVAKSERGYALAAPPADGPAKAEPVKLARGQSSAHAFRTVLHACLRHFRLNEDRFLETRSVGSLHQARVALRRLRSALSLFDAMVADPEVVVLKRRVRAIAVRLGAVRNLDVFIARLERGEGGPDAAEQLAVAREQRAAAAVAAVAALESKRGRAVMLDILAWLEAGAWTADTDRAALRDMPIEIFAAAVLTKRRRGIKRRGRKLARLTPEARHEVRIGAKKLRYASEFFASLVEGRKGSRAHKRFLSALEDLQEHLGELNDVETGQTVAASLGKGVVPGHRLAALAPRDRHEALLSAAADARRTLLDADRFWADWR